MAKRRLISAGPYWRVYSFAVSPSFVYGGNTVPLVFRGVQVDDEQLVYLQNLILVSNEAVTNAFAVYEEDQDPVRLAESLKEVCGLSVACSSSITRTIARTHVFE